MTTAIKHGGHSIFGYVFHVPPPGYLRPTVNRARDIKRLFDIGDISWFGLGDFFIDEMDNKCKRSGANPQQCKGSMMGMKWGNVELILRYSYIKQTFCFYSFSFGQMHFLLPFPGWPHGPSCMHCIWLFDLIHLRTFPGWPNGPSRICWKWFQFCYFFLSNVSLIFHLKM